MSDPDSDVIFNVLLDTTDPATAYAASVPDTVPVTGKPHWAYHAGLVTGVAIVVIGLLVFAAQS